MSHNEAVPSEEIPAGSVRSVEDPDMVLATIEDNLAVGRPRQDLRMSDSIRDDINIDSLSMMEAMTRVEEEVGIELIDNPEIYGVTTVGDLVALIQRVCRARGITTIRTETGK